MAPPTVTVVVLGDIGRSPRMQYHAQSFLKEGFRVNFIGFRGSVPNNYLVSHNNCKIKYIREMPQFFKNLPVLLVYLVKIVWQIWTLLWALLVTGVSCKPQHLLVQTPPAIPALLICWFYCRAVRARFCIDWHNYGYSIMALTHGPAHKLVSISETYEGWVGARAVASLCVTKAMKEDLSRRWSIKAVTMYDRPPEHFGLVTEDERKTLMTRYAELSSERFIDNEGSLRSNRPGLVVSSTSWTEDEDFSILLGALKGYDNFEDPSLPDLVCIITGKGPLKEFYMQKILSAQWRRVTVTSLWLSPEDYPRLLACADLGVSLHSSSSGLDLPMKVVDMFGCGLPVAALDFPCLKELVRHKENGLVFKDQEELCQQLIGWFRGFPAKNSKDQYKSAIEEFQSLRWHDNWKVQAFPLFNLQ